MDIKYYLLIGLAIIWWMRQQQIADEVHVALNGGIVTPAAQQSMDQTVNSGSDAFADGTQNNDGGMGGI